MAIGEIVRGEGRLIQDREMRLSLAAKGLILVSIPLCFELAFVTALISLQRQAEAESAVAIHSKKVAEGISRVSADLFTLWHIISSRTKKQWNETGNFDQGYKDWMDKLIAQYVALEALTADKPEINKRLRASRSILVEAESILDGVRQAVNRGQKTVTIADEAIAVRRLQVIFKQLAEQNQEIDALCRRDWNESAPVDQAINREQALRVATLAAAINVILSLVLAIFLLKDVTGRLKILRDNAMCMASGMPLRAPLKGNDEIAQVDSVFRQMARAMEMANRKERAVVDNALDTICAIDKDGRFSTANPATVRLLGLSPEELLGSRLIDVIALEDRAEMLAWTTRLRENKGEREREFRICKENGSVVDTLWSGHWSEVERSLFFVIHDMTDRKELERARQELVAMLTHDLRSPLTTIRGMIEMASDGMLGDLNERGVRLVKSAERNSLRMINLINDLLDIEKIKSGTMSLKQEPVVVQDLFDDVALSVSDWAAESGIKIKVEASNLVVNCDREKIIRVIFNLVSNAIKFSASGSEIVMQCSRQKQADSGTSFVELMVIDQGSGIAPDMMSTIFERFQQAGDSDLDKGGSGLGLAICKEIVHLHSGKIWVSINQPRGSVFHFTVPCA